MALGGSLLLVGLSLAITGRWRLELHREIVIAVVRSLVQLLVVGAALVPIVDDDTPLVWSWLWVIGIVVFAAITVSRRAPNVRRLVWVSLAAHAGVAVVGLGVVFGFGVFELEGRALVPVAGMVVGNSMKAGVVAANRMVDSLAEQRAEVEARLALGHSARDATQRLLRSALRTAISPQVETTAALGIVFLPGAMTGLLLAGVEPLDAVRAQLALMYVILAGVVVAATITALGTRRLLTTSDERIRYVARRS